MGLNQLLCNQDLRLQKPLEGKQEKSLTIQLLKLGMKMPFLFPNWHQRAVKNHVDMRDRSQAQL